MDAISTHYHLVSEVNVSPVTCNWVIDNFSTFYSNFPRSKTKDNKIVSAPFRFGNDTATKGFFSLVHYMDGICESVIVYRFIADLKTPSNLVFDSKLLTRTI